MAKLTCTDPNMSLISQLNMDKIMSRQPTQKQSPGHNLGFKTFSYKLSKKLKKNSVWITKKAHLCNNMSGLVMRGEIMALVGPDGATTSPDTVLTYSSYGASSYIFPSLVAYFLFSAIQGFSLIEITRYFWRVLYSPLINTNAFVMLVISAMVSRYITCYTAVIVTTVLIFLKFLQISKFLLHYASTNKYPFQELQRNITKCVKRSRMSFSKLHNTKSAAQNWRLIEKDILLTADVYSIKGFCVSLGILLVLGVIYRLFFYVVRTICSKNDRK